MNPTLAVLITYYNERELLRECLDSVLSQPGSPDEVLIYDDASTFPATDYLPDGFQGRVIRGEANQGPSAGRNALLKESRSDYVHFQDSDDLFAPTWAESVRRAMETTQADAIFTETASLREGKLTEGRMGLADLSRDPDLIRFCLRHVICVPAGTYRREVVSTIGGYRLRQAEDADFHMRLSMSNIRYHVIPEPLIRIRVREGGRHYDRRDLAICAFESMKATGPQLPARYRPDLAEAAAWLGYNLYNDGEKERAREAFQLSRSLGRPSYRNHPPLYRTIARLAGPEMATRIAFSYRAWVPDFIRRLAPGRS